MRVPFNSIFTLIDGRIVAKNHVAYGSITVAAGVSVAPTLVIAGNQIKTLTESDLAIEEEDGIVVVVGVYKSNTIIPDSLW